MCTRPPMAWWRCNSPAPGAEGKPTCHQLPPALANSPAAPQQLPLPLLLGVRQAAAALHDGRPAGHDAVAHVSHKLRQRQVGQEKRARGFSSLWSACVPARMRHAASLLPAQAMSLCTPMPLCQQPPLPARPAKPCTALVRRAAPYHRTCSTSYGAAAASRSSKKRPPTPRCSRRAGM